MIFESHAHYDDEDFNEDREELLSSMQENGIGYIVNVGASIRTSEATLKLTEQYSFVYGALGVHPSETAELDDNKLQWLKEGCLQHHIVKKNGKIVAVGEIGLDYHWQEPAVEIQKKWFERQLELSKEVELPIIIHSRDAAKDTLDMVKSLHAGGLGGVIHCFAYTREIAREYLDMGYYIGVGGVVTFANSRKLKEAVEYIPLNRILLETDSPYLAPVPYRGKRNSSLFIPYIAEEIAHIKGIDKEEVISVTAQNAKKLFSVSLL